MKCPHCDNKIGILSKALQAKGKIKSCPYYSKHIEFYMSYKMAAIIIPISFMIALLGIHYLTPYLGGISPLVSGVAGGSLIGLSFTLKKVG